MRVFSLIAALFLIFGAVNLPAQNDKPLVTIAGEKISTAEFERIYKKNNENLFNLLLSLNNMDKNKKKKYMID